MVGITAIGAHVPMYRLNLEEIGKMWQTRAIKGEKAVAGYDEDAITMAVAATLDCIDGSGKDINALYFATTTAPYKEKQSAATIAGATDLGRECHTADFTNSLRAGTIALKAAVDAVKGGTAKQAIVTAVDCRREALQGRFEQLFGDGAAAVMVGSTNVIATVEDSYSVFSDFTDLWRLDNEAFVQTADGRFIDLVGYMPIMKEAISGIMKKCSLAASDFAKVVFYAHDGKGHADFGQKMGFSPAQVQETLFAQIGNTGTAAALMMLVAASRVRCPTTGSFL